jgi:hypothetical protein
MNSSVYRFSAHRQRLIHVITSVSESQCLWYLQNFKPQLKLAIELFLYENSHLLEG